MVPKNFRMSPNLPESNARALAGYFSLCIPRFLNTIYLCIAWDTHWYSDGAQFNVSMGMLGLLFLIHREKLLQVFSQHAMH